MIFWYGCAIKFGRVNLLKSSCYNEEQILTLADKGTATWHKVNKTVVSEPAVLIK